jgi:hypothetical protein
MPRVHVLTMKFSFLQEMPPSEPVEQGDEGEWDTVGEAAGSPSPAPTVEELLAKWSASPLLLRGARNPLLLLRKSSGHRGAEGACRGGTSRYRHILGAPTVTVVRSSL